jgi:hypothetical protein
MASGSGHYLQLHFVALIFDAAVSIDTLIVVFVIFQYRFTQYNHMFSIQGGHAGRNAIKLPSLADAVAASN